MNPVSQAIGLRWPAEPDLCLVITGYVRNTHMSDYAVNFLKKFFGARIFSVINFLDLSVWDCFLKDRANGKKTNSFLYLRLFYQSLLVVCGFFL